MSDYCHQKVLRYPIKDLSEFNITIPKDIDSIREFLEDSFPDLISYHLPGMFQMSPTEKLFLDLVLESDYNFSGEFVKIRDLYPTEKFKYFTTFSKLIPNINMDKVRLVEYCWYDCTEAPDYYEYVKDDFYNPI